MRSTVLIGLACATLPLAGCGSGRGVAPRSGGLERAPQSLAVSDAARRTLDLTARVDFTLKGAQAFGGASAPVLGRGSFDFRTGSGQELIDLPEARHQEFGNE